MIKEDVIWSACFFECEGNLTISTNGQGGYATWVSAGQADKAPLIKLQQLWGGRLYYSKCTGVWVWQLNSRKALPFLEAVKSHIVTPHRWKEIEVYQRFYETLDQRERARIKVWYETRCGKHRAQCRAVGIASLEGTT